MSFVHLHCHSEYSLLDGANRIDDLIARALELEQPALAITDHGNLHAAWEFQEKAKKARLKPIIGIEAYVAPGDRRERGRPRPGAKPYYHLVLLARDSVGYRNLVKPSSLAYTEGFYVKPRVDREILAAHAEGIIVSSACLAGEVAQHLMAGEYEKAKEVAAWYAEVFKDRYYLEVQGHDSEGQDKLNREIFRLGADLGLPVVATNDAHFLRKDDHDAHDILLCIGLGKDREAPDRMSYDRELYFKSAPEMAARFTDHPEVIENSLRIADEVAVEFQKKYHVPACPLKFDLLFERFLNPERVSMPDVDVDFCFERRGEVIEYVREKYGRDSVCQIVTFGTMKSRAAIKDVGRTLGFTPAETDALAKLIPNQPNFSLTVKQAVEAIPDVRRLYDTDERYRQLLDYAMALEGLSRHTGVHAAGVVIAPGPVHDYVPICTQPSKGAGSGDDETVVVTQYDMTALEKAGMLKIDFLGLTTLTVIHDALELIERRTGTRPDLDAIPLDDPD